MNIFLLDQTHALTAQAHPDKLVIKMQLEVSQLLNNAVVSLGFNPLTKLDGSSYGTTHKNHPSSVWICETRANLCYAICHLEALIYEYEFRYKKQSSFRSVLAELDGMFPNYGGFRAPTDYAVAVNNDWLSILYTDGHLNSADFQQLKETKRHEDLAIVNNTYQQYLLYAKTHYAEWRYCEPPVFWRNASLSKYNGRFSKLSYKSLVTA